MALLSMLLAGGCENDNSLDLGSNSFPYLEFYSSSLMYVVVEQGTSLFIYDIVDPGNPTLLGSASMTGKDPHSPLLNYPVLYVCYRATNEVATWDVSNPAAPVEMDSIVIGIDGNNPSGAPPQQLARIGNSLAVPTAGFNSIDTQAVLLDVSNPSSLSILDVWSFNGVNNYEGRTVAAYGTTFFFGILRTLNNTFASVSSSTFTTIDSLGLTSGGAVVGRHVLNSAGTRAYINGNSGTELAIINISDPANLSQITSASLVGAVVANGSNPIAFRESSNTIYFGSMGIGAVPLIVCDVTGDVITQGTSISLNNDAQTDIKILNNECSSLAVGTIGDPKVYLKGTPPTS